MLKIKNFTYVIFIIVLINSFCLQAANAKIPDSPDDILILDNKGALIFELQVPVQTFTQSTIESQNVTYSSLSIPGWKNTGKPGSPELPYKSVFMGVPFGVDLSLKITPGNSQKIHVPHQVIPVSDQDVQWPLSKTEETFLKPDVFQQIKPNPQIYQNSASYPGILAEVANDGVLRQQRVVSVAVYPIQYNLQENTITIYESIKVEVEFIGIVPGAKSSLDSDSPIYETILAQTLLNYDQARNWRGSEPQNEILSTQTLSNDQIDQNSMTSWTPPDNAWRIAVKEQGFYQLTYAELDAAGIPVTSLDPRNFQLFYRGEQVAIRVIGETDGQFQSTDKIIFYAEEPSNKYTTDNVYWLSVSNVPGLRMTTRDGSPGTAETPSYYTNKIYMEDNNYYRSPMPGSDDFERFIWDTLSTFNKPTWSYTFTLPTLVPGPGKLSVSMLGYILSNISPDHHVRVSLNGTVIGDTWWDGISWRNVTFNIPSGVLVAGSNTITLTCPNDTGVGYDVVYIDKMQLEYLNSFSAENDYLEFKFSTAGTWKFQVNGFTDDLLAVYNIDNPNSPVVINNFSIFQQDLKFSALFEDSILYSSSYFVTSESAYKTVSDITTDTPSNLQDISNAADYVIITHQAFWSQAQKLANHRSSQGLQVVVVDVQDIYDEFSYGITGAPPIKDFLAYTYENWQLAPSYVVLIGDGHFDPKNYLGFERTSYIPPYLAVVEPDLGETAADNRYVSIVGADNFPDMILGRLSVNSPSEADVVIDKIINYETYPVEGDWLEQILAIADNTDPAGNFSQMSETLLNTYFPETFSTQEIYLDITHTTEAAKLAIKDSINNGKLFVHYIGHGSYNFWASEQLLKTSDIPLLTNGGKLPIVLAMTCLEGYFHFPDLYANNYEALAEVITRADGRGAIASWSPSGLGVATGHNYLNSGFFWSFFQNGAVTVGEATIVGKLMLWGSGDNLDLLDTYHLFGDPALLFIRGLTAVNDSYTTPMNSTLEVDSTNGILSNDINPQDLSITAELVSTTSHGSLNLNTNGSFSYVPDNDWYGLDSFSYRIATNDSYSNTAIVRIYVPTDNHPPVAVNDNYSVNEDDILIVTEPGVLENDTDQDSDSLIASILSSPLHGLLSFASDGSFTYTPNPNYHGLDSFSYRAYDGQSYSNSAIVNLTVNPINDQPVISDIPDQTINEGEIFTTILLDDYISDIDNLSEDLIWSSSGATDLTVSILDRVATITLPSVNWNGSETITFTATDPGGLSDQDSVTFTVSAVNDAPVNSLPDPQTTLLNTALVFSTSNLVSVSDVDVAETEGGQLQVTLSVAHGSLTLSQVTGLTFSSGDGTADTSMIFTGLPAAINAALIGMHYTPTTGYTGSDTLSITTNDLGNTGAGGALSDTDTLSITILDNIRIYIPLILK